MVGLWWAYQFPSMVNIQRAPPIVRLCVILCDTLGWKLGHAHMGILWAHHSMHYPRMTAPVVGYSVAYVEHVIVSFLWDGLQYDGLSAGHPRRHVGMPVWCSSWGNCSEI